jgi:endonuclease III
MSNSKMIVKKLISKGKSLFNTPLTQYQFTENESGNQFLNDLSFPHAFVLGCLMDRRMPTKQAWLIPYELYLKLRSFQFTTLSNLSLQEIYEFMTSPVRRHRFPELMAVNFYSAIQRIGEVYDGDASKIWLGKPPSAKVVYEFLQFKGIGQKIATMAANILARQFRIPFADYYSIDISVDSQVRRVMPRLGLVEFGAPDVEIIYKARMISAEFPGLIDFPLWEIGREWCRPTNPRCNLCYMESICPSHIGEAISS